MDIYRMQNEAKNRPEGRRKFKIIGPLGEMEAWWEDPYFGLLTIGERGTFMVKQFDNAFPPLYFEWLPDPISNEMG